MDSIIEGASSAGATLLFGDNLYAYGPVDGPLTEDLPCRATGSNGRTWARRDTAARSRGRTGSSGDRLGLGLLRAPRSTLPMARLHPPGSPSTCDGDVHRASRGLRGHDEPARGSCCVSRTVRDPTNEIGLFGRAKHAYKEGSESCAKPLADEEDDHAPSLVP